MEEEGGAMELPNPNHNNLDPSTHKKHLSMLDRLSKSHQDRLQSSQGRRSDSSSVESTSSFLSRFSDSKQFIDSLLAQSRLVDQTQLKPHFEKISDSISDLDKLVAESSYFLPSYEVRSSLKTISDLKQSLENLNAELIPRKKFSFRNKGSKKDPTNGAKDAGVAISGVSVPQKFTFTVPDSPGFRNKTGEILTKHFSGSETGEFTISDLDSCEVRLMGCVRALFVHRLRNCKVYSGPISGSVLIEEVEGCVLVLASHQIRIHHAKRTDFYLRVRSRPIVEDSSSVRFAPYCLCYEGLEEDLKSAGLDEETGNWENVDDFRWLRAVQSPNWSVLPENERGDVVNISSSESGAEGC